MLDTRYWILDSLHRTPNGGYWILDGCDGSLVNLVNMVICLLIAGGEKNTPSIMRATCTFDAKKVLDFRFVILVTQCRQGS